MEGTPQGDLLCTHGLLLQEQSCVPLFWGLKDELASVHAVMWDYCFLDGTGWVSFP
jgi:hypothetical protein